MFGSGFMELFTDKIAAPVGSAKPTGPATNYPRDLLGWAKWFLPHHCTDPFSRMHLELAQRLDRVTTNRIRKVREVDQAPRGSAKSTIFMAYALRESLERREPYTMIVSETDSQAVEFLRTYRSELEENPRIAESYPDAVGVGPTWSDHQLLMNNGVMLRALGSGGRARGRKHGANRPGLIIIDDPQDKESVHSSIKRDRIYDAITRDIIKSGSKDVNVWVIGTPVHPDAVVCRLEEMPGWVSRRYRAIEQYPDRMDLWENWEQILQSGHDDETLEKATRFYRNNPLMDRGAKVLWPDRESLYDLMIERAASGHAAFDAEKQCEPLDPSIVEWPGSYFNWQGFWFDAWPDDLAVKTLYLDPAISEDARVGDWSAFVLYGDRGPAEDAYCQAWMYRLPAEQIAAAGCDIYQRNNPDAFGYESNAFQKLLGKFFRDEAAKRKIVVNGKGNPNKKHKPIRIRRLSGLLASRRIHFHRDPHTMELVKQLKQFPTGKHDDGPDALSSARGLADELRGSKK